MSTLRERIADYSNSGTYGSPFKIFIKMSTDHLDYKRGHKRLHRATLENREIHRDDLTYNYRHCKLRSKNDWTLKDALIFIRMGKYCPECI